MTEDEIRKEYEEMGEELPQIRYCSNCHAMVPTYNFYGTHCCFCNTHTEYYSECEYCKDNNYIFGCDKCQEN